MDNKWSEYKQKLVGATNSWPFPGAAAGTWWGSTKTRGMQSCWGPARTGLEGPHRRQRSCTLKDFENWEHPEQRLKQIWQQHVAGGQKRQSPQWTQKPAQPQGRFVCGTLQLPGTGPEHHTPGHRHRAQRTSPLAGSHFCGGRMGTFVLPFICSFGVASVWQSLQKCQLLGNYSFLSIARQYAFLHKK